MHGSSCQPRRDSRKQNVESLEFRLKVQTLIHCGGETVIALDSVQVHVASLVIPC